MAAAYSEKEEERLSQAKLSEVVAPVEESKEKSNEGAYVLQFNNDKLLTILTSGLEDHETQKVLQNIVRYKPNSLELVTARKITDPTDFDSGTPYEINMGSNIDVSDIQTIKLAVEERDVEIQQQKKEIEKLQAIIGELEQNIKKSQQ